MPSGADLLGAADRPLALVPAAEAVQDVGRAAQQMGTEEAHQRRAARDGRDAALRDGDGLLESTATSRTHTQFAYARPMSSTLPTSSAIAERRRGRRCHPSTSPPTARSMPARVQRVALDVPGADGAGEVEGLLGQLRATPGTGRRASGSGRARRRPGRAPRMAGPPG